MYKKASKFQDYMSRSNRFVDRIIRGGNSIDTGLVYEESDLDLLQDSFIILLEIKAGLLNDTIRFKDELSEVRRRLFSSRGGNKKTYKLILNTAERQHRETLSALNLIEAYKSMIESRLSHFGVQTPRDHPGLSEARPRKNKPRKIDPHWKYYLPQKPGGKTR